LAKKVAEAQATIREQAGEIARLREALSEALDEWQDSGQFMGEYLWQKYDNQGRIDAFRRLLDTPARKDGDARQ
jgi:hypothetical protein